MEEAEEEQEQEQEEQEQQEQEEQEEMLDHEMFLGTGIYYIAIQNMKLNVFQNPPGFQATCEIACGRDGPATSRK